MPRRRKLTAVEYRATLDAFLPPDCDVYERPAPQPSGQITRCPASKVGQATAAEVVVIFSASKQHVTNGQQTMITACRMTPG